MSAGIRTFVLLADSLHAGGGIAQYNRDLVDALHRVPGAEVELACYVRNGGTRLPGRTFALASTFALGALLQARRFRPSIVFCGHLHLAPLAAFVAGRTGARLWLQCHGIEAWGRPTPRRRRAASGAHLVTCVSRHTMRQVQRWIVPNGAHLRVLPNTIEERFSNQPRSGARHGPILLTVGRLHEAERYKGHDRVIALLPALRQSYPALRYVIAGSGNDSKRLLRVAGELGVADCVELTGEVDRSRLEALYREADLMVMPSTGEGFGIAFVEAMASGTLALGLDCDGSIDALGDGELGVAASAQSLEVSVREALGRVIDRERLAEATRRRFGRSRFVEHVGRLVSELGSR